MLRIQSNTRYHKLTYEPIKLYNGTLMSRNDNVMVPVEHTEDGGSGHYTGDIIQFERHDGSKINFTERRAVQAVENASGYDRFVLIGFDRVNLYFDEFSLLEKSIIPGEATQKMLYLHLTNEHFYLKNRDNDEISGFVNCSFMEENREYGCPGDLIVHDDIFLLKIGATEQDGRYRYGSSSVLNYKTTVYVEKDGEIHSLNAIVPVYSDGTDNTSAILLTGNDSLVEEIAANPYGCVFYGKDERFFTESVSFEEGEDVITTLFPTVGTEVKWRNGDLRLNVFAPQTFDATLGQDDTISQFIQEISDKAINKIVDYEKQQFVPVKNEKDVSKIVFKIHLRERTDFDEWKSNDNLLWFNYAENNLSGDSVYYMGFDEEDIYYQKKKVSETFLRVSIYDRPDRRSQKLLYTAKIFLNESNLYGKYIDNLQSTGETWFNDVFNEYSDAKVSEGKYSISGCPLAPIQTEFICTHKYDYDNPTEGFYLHLFPSHLIGESDSADTQVFMKCELNNAKYGYTIPLVNFYEDIVGGYMKQGPINESGDTGYTVDMEMFYKDAYIPIIIRENDETGRYEWEFENDNIEIDEDGTIVLQMFEPRINGDSGKISDDKHHSGPEGEEPDDFDDKIPYVPYWPKPNGGSEPGVVPDPSGGGDEPGPGPGPGPTPGGGSFDAYFNHANTGRYPSTTYDRDYNSDSFGLTPTVVNTKYPYVTAVFSSEPAGLSMSYKQTGWGGYKSTSFNDRTKITESKMGMSVGIGENKTENIRYYYIDYVSPDGSDRRRLTVRHLPIQYYILLSTNPTRVDYKHNTKRVILTTGTEYSRLSVTSANDDFFTYSVELHEIQTWNGFNRYVYFVNLNISENESATPRSGWVKFAINDEKYDVMDVVQSGNTNAGYSADVDGYTYTIEASITPNYIQEVKEDRTTDYQIVATLYKKNNATGVKEPSNDWTKYGVGLYKYCEPSTYSSYGYKQVTMYEDNKTDSSTITYTENAPELKYVDSTKGYCFAAIVNGQIVTSGTLKVNYCDMLLKYTAACYLFNENEITFNSETNSLTFNMAKCVSMSHSEYLSADGSDYDVTYRYSQSIGGSFGLEPGTYYAVYGTIYSSDHYIEGSIKLSYQGRELSVNDDTNTPWKYDDLNNRVNIFENTSTRRHIVGYSDTMVVGTEWVCISEPIELTSGTFKLDISYVADTRNKKGTCNGGDTPETKEYDVDFIGSLDKEGGEVEYDAYFTGSLDKVESEEYDAYFTGSLDKEDLPTAYFYWYKDERLSQPFEDADENLNTFTTNAEELWVTPHSSIQNSTISPTCVHLTKYNREATVDVVVRYRLFVYPSWARYPNIKWCKDEAGTQVISEGTATDIYTSERPVWAYITYEDCIPQNVQLTLNEQQKSVWLEKSEYTFTVNLFPEDARSTAVYKWYQEEEKWHPIRTANGNTVTYSGSEVYCVVTADGYIGTEFWVSFYDDALTKDVTLEEVPVEITVTPMIGEIGGEDTAFVLAVSNNKNREMNHSVSVRNTNSLSTLPTDQDFKICSNQINIGNGNAIFVILRQGYSNGYLNTTTGRFTVSTEGYDDIQRTLTASSGSEHSARARKVSGGGYGVFTTVRLMPYTTQNVDISVDLIGVLTGAAEIEGNTKRGYDNNIYAEETTTVVTTYTCSNGPQNLTFDSAEMLPTNLMSLSLGIKYSTFGFTILPNNTDRIRLGFASVYADVTGTRPGSENSSRHIYIDTVIQESENLRFVLNENALTGSYPGTFLYRIESKILEVIDLSKHGTVYEIPIDNTDDDYRIWVLSDIRNNISVTSLNGQATTTLVSDGCVRYGFTTNTTKDGDYYHDGFRIEIF